MMTTNRQRMKHELQTPTLTFTLAGLLFLWWWWFRHPTSDPSVPAFVLLLMAGGGTGLALAAEVQDKGYEWGWLGLARALRHPSRKFWYTFGTHAPQLMLALWIALTWRHNGRR
jgi:MFS superfamily sulfate permease-like transporter